VSDGTRTRDRLDHNQELYQLSYAHHGDCRSHGTRRLAVAGARYARRMTNDDKQRDTDEAREAQGLPDDGPGSKTTPPSNPKSEAGETEKGKEKLGKIVNW
jgi:hypothetical protein